MDTIYHVTTRSEWDGAMARGSYAAPSLQAEGFIHCSTAAQVDGVLGRYFQGKQDLVKLVIDPSKLAAALKYETAPSIGESFPHIYGEINIDAVTAVENISPSR